MPTDGVSVRALKPFQKSELEKQVVPTLFVGVGGTGKDVLMRLRKRFFDDDPHKKIDYVRYLIIDTDARRWAPGGEAVEGDFEAVRPKADEIVSCAISERDFIGAFDRLEHQRDKRYAGWLKAEMRRYGPAAVKDGAGTHRQFGRLAFMLNFDAIRTHIEGNLEALVRAAHRDPRHGVVDADVDPNKVEVAIVTSLAGGTGSGMFLDLDYLMRDILENLGCVQGLEQKYVTLFAVLPKAFKDKGPEAQHLKYQQNAYSALLEMENYGTAQTSEEVYIGKSNSQSADNIRVGFDPPWPTRTGRTFIEGQGWDACYLIDNTGPLMQQVPLKLEETYQMVADYLFLDFKQSAFGKQKRSSRCNLRQFQQDPIHSSVSTPSIRNQSGDIVNRHDQEAIYATQCGRTFSSFGLAEIVFDKERVYRSASYCLASMLIKNRWLQANRAARWQKSDLEAAAKIDLFKADDAPEAPKFTREYLIGLLFRKGRGSWLKLIDDDLEKVQARGPVGASALLRKMISHHLGLLQVSDGGGGGAGQTIVEQERLLAGTPRELGDLRKRLREIVDSRTDELGIVVAESLTDYYREELLKCRRQMAEAGDAGRPNPPIELLRLEEADAIAFHVRGKAQAIEFPRACGAVRTFIRDAYARAASPAADRLLATVLKYLGAPGQPVPDDLNAHRTISRHLEDGVRLLKDIEGRLKDRFSATLRDEGTLRKQSLLPADWDETRYEALINTAITHTSGFDSIGSDSAARPDWGRISERVLALLRDSVLRGHDEIRSITSLVDYWTSRYQQSEEDLTKMTENLAQACRIFLQSDAPLNLEDFEHGSVVDLLMKRTKEREHRLKELLRASAPYFCLDFSHTEEMTGYYRPVFENLLGLKEGDNKNFSKTNADNLVSTLESMRQEGQIDGNLDVLEGGTPSSLVVCREVWGVPLMYYRGIDELYRAYENADRAKSELHICYRRGAEELPDVRAINPAVFAKIQGNTEHVLFALLDQTITCSNDGRFTVEVPNPIGGVDRREIGSKLHRIIRRCCEDDQICGFLQRSREKRQGSAKPQHWAALYVAALKTYSFSRETYVGENDRDANETPPLRNGFNFLIDQFRARLDQTDEGKQWFDYLRDSLEDRDDNREEKHAQHLKVVDQLITTGLLSRAASHVPIWQVNWPKLESLKLPSTTEKPV